MSGKDFSDPATIAVLTEALRSAGVDGIEIEHAAGKLRIVLDGGMACLPQVSSTLPGAKSVGSDTVRAPLAGLFALRHPSSPAEPSVLPRTVAAGETLAFLRIGPILLPVAASGQGRLLRCLAEDGGVVGYGDPLFDIELHP